MFARFGNLVLILALLCATGTHWVVLQSVAWATMLADNARTDSFTAALQKTFDGKHPCCLCKQIAAGKQSERKSDMQLQANKLDFLNTPLAISFTAPGQFRLQPQLSTSANLLADAPPVPPPRCAAV